MNLNWFSLVLAFCATVSSYKILVYNSKYAHSHSNFLGRITDVLADAGHNVTSLISVIDPNGADGTSKSNKIYVQQTAASAELQEQFKKMAANLFDSDSFDLLGSYFMGAFFGKIFATQCKAVIEDTRLIEKLKAEKYDVMFMENFDMCGVALTELIQPKSFIPTSSSIAFGPHEEEWGIATALSYNPEHHLSRMNVHSMWDRLVNLYARFLVRLTFDQFRGVINTLFREKFG
ncbi:hypothetical protein PFISCL1PPCAC_7206, partial [Pristionchus fissidentatus]